jgi:hypothetical protein
MNVFDPAIAYPCDNRTLERRPSLAPPVPPSLSPLRRARSLEGGFLGLKDFSKGGKRKRKSGGWETFVNGGKGTLPNQPKRPEPPLFARDVWRQPLRFRASFFRQACPPVNYLFTLPHTQRRQGQNSRADHTPKSTL